MSGIIGDNVGRASGLIKAAGGGGKVLQVVGVTDTTFRTYSVNDWYDHSGLDLAITPSATSSKIFISFQVGMKGPNDYSCTIFRDTTNLGNADNGLARLKYWTSFGGSILDSPSTTSEIIYSHQFRANDGVASKYNYVGAETSPGTTAHMVAMEIDGS